MARFRFPTWAEITAALREQAPRWRGLVDVGHSTGLIFEHPVISAC